MRLPSYRKHVSKSADGTVSSDLPQRNNQSLLYSLEIERKRIQGSDRCMHAKARDDIEHACKVQSDMANKMRDAID